MTTEEQIAFERLYDIAIEMKAARPFLSRHQLKMSLALNTKVQSELNGGAHPADVLKHADVSWRFILSPFETEAVH